LSFCVWYGRYHEGAFMKKLSYTKHLLEFGTIICSRINFLHPKFLFVTSHIPKYKKYLSIYSCSIVDPPLSPRQDVYGTTRTPIQPKVSIKAFIKLNFMGFTPRGS